LYKYFWWHGGWTQGLEIARQVLYHPNPDSRPFWLYFFRSLHYFPPASYNLWSSYLCFPSSCDYSHGPPCLALTLQYFCCTFSMFRCTNTKPLCSNCLQYSVY
jgi:hypothetical protein